MTLDFSRFDEVKHSGQQYRLGLETCEIHELQQLLVSE